MTDRGRETETGKGESQREGEKAEIRKVQFLTIGDANSYILMKFRLKCGNLSELWVPSRGGIDFCVHGTQSWRVEGGRGIGRAYSFANGPGKRVLKAVDHVVEDVCHEDVEIDGHCHGHQTDGKPNS